jgi:hypothetical protein
MDQKIASVGFDILRHRDDDFAALRLQVGGPLEPAPDLGLRRAAIKLQEDHLADVGQRFMHDDAFNALDVEHLLQMFEIERLVGDLF